MHVDKDIFHTLVKSGIQQALASFVSANPDDMLSDLSIKLDKENGRVLIYDDLENLLSEKEIEIWSDDNTPELPAKSFIKKFKFVLNDLSKQSVFDKDFIFNPFSVNLVDEQFGYIEELLFLGGDTIKLDSESLLDLDKELSDFLKDLLNE
jgi:hypothetical protein